MSLLSTAKPFQRIGSVIAACLLNITIGLSSAFGTELSLEQRTVAEIRQEASLSSSAASGRPLPLFSSWNTGETGTGFTPQKQIELIRQGHHILPALFFPPPDRIVNKVYFAPALEFIASNNLPVTLVSTQWEGIFLNSSENKANAQSAAVTVRADKLVLNPWADRSLWAEAGNNWGTSSTLKYLQEKMPDPAKIIFLSNNEASKPRWYDMLTNGSLLGKIPMSQATPAGLGGQLNNQWRVLYPALINGLKTQLTNPAWKKSAEFIGFDALVPSHIGRYYDWNRDSQLDETSLKMWSQIWDGASLPYYLNDWDASTFYQVWSPQLEAMNYLPALQWARAQNPEYWHEMSVWDGHIAKSPEDKLQFFKKQNRELTSCRYSGFVKFGLWLQTPRVVREFRFYNEGYAEQAYAAEAIMQAVDTLYVDKTLEQFWRKSDLIANDEGKHPYDEQLPDSYRKAARWFLLSSPANKTSLKSLDDEIRVFALARKISDPDNTRYLVYTFAPFLSADKVSIKVPGLGERMVNSSPCGAYTVLAAPSATDAPPAAPSVFQLP